MEDTTVQQTTEAAPVTLEQNIGDLLGIDMPTIDTPEVTPDPIVEPQAPPVIPDEQNVPSAPEVPPAPSTQPSGTYNPVVEQMRSTFAQQGIAVEIPEEFSSPDVSADRVFQFINEKIQENYITKDPFLNSYVQAKQSGKTPDEFIQEKVQQDQLLKAPDKDFIKRLYRARNGKTEQNPDGYTDQQIEQHVAKMSAVEVHEMAKSYKEQLRQKFNTASPQSASPEVLAEQVKVSNQEASKIADNLFSTMSTRTEFGGIPHTAEDMESFKPVFKDLIERNPETGVPRVQELLNNDETLYQVMFLYNKLNGGWMNQYLSQFKEGYKDKILRQTGIKPEVQSGNTIMTSMPTTEDFV